MSFPIDYNTPLKAKIHVDYGVCPGMAPTIIISPVLGGGGVQQNYYVNFYIKDDIKNCHTVSIMPQPSYCGYPNGARKKLTLMFSQSNLMSTQVTEFGYGVSYGVATPYQVRMNDFIVAATGYGRQFVVTGNKLEVYLLDTDPLFSITQTTLTELLPDNYLHVGAADECPPPLITDKEICGWEPIAGGYGLFTYTPPPKPGIYMVEITDEHFVTSYAIVEITIDKNQNCFIESKNISFNGKKDGFVKALVPADNGPFLFFWYDSSSNLISKDMEVYDLSPGTYCLELVDSLGCKRNCCVTLTEPAPFEIELVEWTPGDCEGKGNSYRFEISGGVVGCSDICADKGDYFYRLNEGPWKNVRYNNTIIFKDLPLGKYTLEVKDCACNIVSYEFEVKDLTIKFDI